MRELLGGTGETRVSPMRGLHSSPIWPLQYLILSPPLDCSVRYWRQNHCTIYNYNAMAKSHVRKSRQKHRKCTILRPTNSNHTTSNFLQITKEMEWPPMFKTMEENTFWQIEMQLNFGFPFLSKVISSSQLMDSVRRMKIRVRGYCVNHKVPSFQSLSHNTVSFW